MIVTNIQYTSMNQEIHAATPFTFFLFFSLCKKAYYLLLTST